MESIMSIKYDSKFMSQVSKQMKKQNMLSEATKIIRENNLLSQASKIMRQQMQSLKQQ